MISSVLFKMEAPKILAVFDFDHTLVDGNTDTWILDLYPMSRQQMKQQKSEGCCWTDIMHGIFKLLHGQNVKKQDYERCFVSLPFTEGMKETCDFLRNKKIPSIIISDSNSYFIEHLLQRDSLQELFSNIYTNPASWSEDGCLNVERYHSHACKRCPQNLCKGKVLRKYIDEYKIKTRQEIDCVVYVGDGHGDACAAMAVESGGSVLAREGYTLLSMLKKEQEISDGALPHAKVVPWKTGFDVLKEFQMIYQEKTLGI